MKAVSQAELNFGSMSLVYLSIYWTYIAPLQSNYSEVLPAQARSKRTATYSASR